MNDLISRQAAIEINQSYHGQMPNEVNYRIWKEINELPSAQPEIIRCKDCKYSSHEPYKDQADVYVCNYSYWTRAEGGRYTDWYCARAERRTDAEIH